MSSQMGLFKPQRAQKKSLNSVAKSHDENNLHAAKEILANMDAYGGEGSGMVDWARAVVKRLEPT